MQASQEERLAPLTAGIRDALSELVQALLPDLARRVIQEEIERIRAEEQGLPAGEELVAVIREAFQPTVERIAREMTREMVLACLPEVAERLVREEIVRIRQSG